MSSDVLAEILRDYRGYRISGPVLPFPDGKVGPVLSAVDPAHDNRRVVVVFAYKFKKDTLAQLLQYARPDVHLIVVGGDKTPMWRDPALAELVAAVARLETIPQDHLYINILSYFLTPIYCKISERDLPRMVRREQLMPLPETDKPIRLLGFQEGDIVSADVPCEIIGRKTKYILITQLSDCI